MMLRLLSSLWMDDAHIVALEDTLVNRVYIENTIMCHDDLAHVEWALQRANSLANVTLSCSVSVGVAGRLLTGEAMSTKRNQRMNRIKTQRTTSTGCAHQVEEQIACRELSIHYLCAACGGRAVSVRDAVYNHFTSFVFV